MGMLEAAIRDDLNQHAPRAFCVLRPLKLVISNWPADKVEILDAPKHPQNESMGTRTMPMTREVFIDREDFLEEANKKFKRLVLGDDVRLYDRLFTEANPDKVEEGETFLSHINAQSLTVLQGCLAEESLKGALPETRYQFEREGYFCVDPDSSDSKLVFNLTVGLKEG